MIGFNRIVRRSFKRITLRHKPKLFCIGLNKTGTTSLEKACKNLGFCVDDQNEAHKLMYNYEKREFGKIVDHCKNAEVFQDSPFSMKFTYLFLEQAYPDAKFILTVRDSPEQWYESFVRFQTKLFGTNGNIPTKDDLLKAKRPHGRSVYDNIRMRFGTSDENLFDKEILTAYYTTHNNEVMDYFRLLPEKLLILNLSSEDAYPKFCSFIGVTHTGGEFPWLNKS